MPFAPFKPGESVANDVSQATETMMLAFRTRADVMNDGPLALRQTARVELTCANRSVVLSCQEVKGRSPTMGNGRTIIF